MRSGTGWTVSGQFHLNHHQLNRQLIFSLHHLERLCQVLPSAQESLRSSLHATSKKSKAIAPKRKLLSQSSLRRLVVQRRVWASAVSTFAPGTGQGHSSPHLSSHRKPTLPGCWPENPLRASLRALRFSTMTSSMESASKRPKIQDGNGIVTHSCVFLLFVVHPRDVAS